MPDPQRLWTTSHVLRRTMSSTSSSMCTILASFSVRLSVTVNLAEYGSKRSFISRSCFSFVSSSRAARLGSCASGRPAISLQYCSTVDRDSHAGKSCALQNVSHSLTARPFVILGVRCAVEDGSKATRDGVSNALRFWLMESSTADRESRRKSIIQHVSFLEV